MTKKQWISYIKNHLRRIDETNKYHNVVVERTIDTVHSQMFSEMYAKSKRGLYQYLKEYTETITGPLPTAAGDAVSVSYLPVNLPRINGGVFDVYYKVGGTGDKVPCELTGKDMFDRAMDSTYDTLGVQGKHLVSYFDNGLYFDVAQAATNVIYYKILPRFSTMADTDEVKLPVGAEEVLADRVLDTMRMIPPVDLMNDNADANG